MNLKHNIFEALSIKNPDKCKFSKIDSGFEIEVGAMYESPATINFKTLSALSRLVGTEEINVDDYAYGGCESCDWGSDYGHTIQILNPTLRVDELEELCV